MTEPMPHLNLAALISGGGRTLLNLMDAIERGELNATITRIIASRDCAGVERVLSRDADSDLRIIRRSAFDSEAAMHDAMTETLIADDIDLICCCGWLRYIRVDEPLKQRIINIHPSLLPAFGGRGMHGMNVHRAVIESGATESGCTVHWVDEQYDHGPTILQRRCPVMPDDTPEDLAARVFAEECVAYPAAIAKLQPPNPGMH